MYFIGSLAVALSLQHGLLSDSAVHAILLTRVNALPDTGKHGEGIVVGLLEKGRRVIAVGVGGDDVFEIGSITKVFTASTLADMVTRGEVRLDDPVAKYLPSSVHVPSRNGRQITLLDLATQSSGLPRMPANFARAHVPHRPHARGRAPVRPGNRAASVSDLCRIGLDVLSEGGRRPADVPAGRARATSERPAHPGRKVH